MKQESIKDIWFKYQKNPELYRDELVGAVSSLVEGWKSARGQQYDKQWIMNLDFYRGNHYVRDYSASSGAPYRVRLKENHTNNILQRMISIFIQNMPITRVFSNSTDWEDWNNAETSEQFIKYIWRQFELEQKLGSWVKHAAIFGPAWISVDWDANAGGVMSMDSSESDEPKKYFKGDFKIKVDDPFKYNVRPGIDRFEDMYDYARSEIMSRSAIETLYGPITGDAPSPNMYRTQTRYGVNSNNDPDAILVNHYYHKPTSWFEKGLYVCWTGKNILKASDFPYDDNEFPAEYLGFDIPPMQFYGMSTIEQVMDLQEQLNKAASMIIEARNLIARPRVLVSHEAQVPVQSLSDRPGEVLRYKQAGGAPRFETPSFNFGELSAHKADVRNALSSVTGITTASRGEIPAAARTALALQLVLEQDRSQYLPFIKSFHNGILRVTKKILARAAQFIPQDDPRAIKIDRWGSSKLFHGGMVPSPLDMYLEDTNPLGWTATGRIEGVGHLAQLGVIKDPNRILEMIGLTNVDPAFDSIKINKQAAQMEIERLNKGEMIGVGPEDDDAAHLDEHIKIPQSFAFRQMPKIVQEAHLRHIDSHKNRLTGGNQPPAQAPQGKVMSGVNPAELASGAALAIPGNNMNTLLSKPG